MQCYLDAPKCNKHKSRDSRNPEGSVSVFERNILSEISATKVDQSMGC